MPSSVAQNNKLVKVVQHFRRLSIFFKPNFFALLPLQTKVQAEIFGVYQHTTFDSLGAFV
jgi:hypothetical protein